MSPTALETSVRNCSKLGVDEQPVVDANRSQAAGSKLGTLTAEAR
jgi:hypothetical protein